MEWEKVLINMKTKKYSVYVSLILALGLFGCSPEDSVTSSPNASSESVAGKISVAQSEAAQGPTQYPTALAAFEALNDYTPEDDTLAIDSIIGSTAGR